MAKPPLVALSRGASPNLSSYVHWHDGSSFDATAVTDDAPTGRKPVSQLISVSEQEAVLAISRQAVRRVLLHFLTTLNDGF